MANAINWFEIPATNFNRAAKFYGDVLGAEVHSQELMGTKMGFLPSEPGQVGGAICTGEGYAPSMEGSLVYLNGGDDLSRPLGNVEKAGGTVMVPKTKVSDEIGYIAIFSDTEGNRVAFHSPK